MRYCSRIVIIAALLQLTATAALAQATIAGVVRDSSGGALPGVTVEATSPSLTEKVRTAVTDGTGQYRIVTLPPGNYTVTFSLTGFATVKRDDVSVSGSGVIPINADLRVGSLQETITVSGDVADRRHADDSSRDRGRCGNDHRAADYPQLWRRALRDAGPDGAARRQQQRPDAGHVAVLGAMAASAPRGASSSTACRSTGRSARTA